MLSSKEWKGTTVAKQQADIQEEVPVHIYK